jgi:hypothetical protein
MNTNDKQLIMEDFSYSFLLVRWYCVYGGVVMGAILVNITYCIRTVLLQLIPCVGAQ